MKRDIDEHICHKCSIHPPGIWRRLCYLEQPATRQDIKDLEELIYDHHYKRDLNEKFI